MGPHELDTGHRGCSDVLGLLGKWRRKQSETKNLDTTQQAFRAFFVFMNASRAVHAVIAPVLPGQIGPGLLLRV